MATERSPRAEGETPNRLVAFMNRHELGTGGELAQVFRVGQATASRWLNPGQRPLEEVLPGPAMILLELMEAGHTTPDLEAVKALAAIHARPWAFEDIDGEIDWTVELPARSRLGVKLVSGTGHFLVVHSGWINDRITKIESLRASDPSDDARRAAIVERYRDVLRRLSALPR